MCEVVQPAQIQHFGQVAEFCSGSPPPSEPPQAFLRFYNEAISAYTHENMPKPAPHQTFYYLTLEGAEASGRFEGCMSRREAISAMLSSSGYLPTHYHTQRQALSALPTSDEPDGLASFQSTGHARSVFLTLFNNEKAVWTKHFRSRGFPLAHVSLSMNCTKVAPQK